VTLDLVVLGCELGDRDRLDPRQLFDGYIASGEMLVYLSSMRYSNKAASILGTAAPREEFTHRSVGT
jgi:hypothetical protein